MMFIVVHTAEFTRMEGLVVTMTAAALVMAWSRYPSQHHTGTNPDFPKRNSKLCWVSEEEYWNFYS